MASSVVKGQEFANRGQFINEGNWNDFIYPGWYASFNSQNRPADGWLAGIVVNLGSIQFPVQIAVRSDHIYIRWNAGGGFTNWTTL